MDSLAVEGVRPPASVTSLPGGGGLIGPARRSMGKLGPVLAAGGRVSPLPVIGGGDRGATPVRRRRPSSRGPTDTVELHRAEQDPSSALSTHCGLGWTKGTAAVAPQRARPTATNTASLSPDPDGAETKIPCRGSVSSPVPVPPTTPLRAPALRRSGSLRGDTAREEKTRDHAKPKARRANSASDGSASADAAPAAASNAEAGGPPRRVDTGLRELRQRGFRVLRRRSASRKPSAEFRRAVSTRPRSESRPPSAALPAATARGDRPSPRPATGLNRPLHRAHAVAASPKGPVSDPPAASATPARQWRPSLDTGQGVVRRNGATPLRAPAQRAHSEAKDEGRDGRGRGTRAAMQVNSRAEQQRAQQRAVERAKRVREEEANKDSLAREAVDARRRARKEAREEEEQRRAEVYAINAIMRAWNEQRAKRGGAGPAGGSGVPASPGGANDRGAILGV